MTEDRTQPASLVGAVLDEESRRQADAAAADSEVAVDVATLPGVGGDEVPLRRRSIATGADCSSPSARCGASALRSSR